VGLWHDVQMNTDKPPVLDPAKPLTEQEKATLEAFDRAVEQMIESLNKESLLPDEEKSSL